MTEPSPGLHTKNSISKQTKDARRRKEVRSESREEEDKKRDGKGRGEREGEEMMAATATAAVTMEPGEVKDFSR